MDNFKLPEGFTPPTLIKKEKYVLEPLHPKHNEMDYEAWNSCKANLKGIFGPKNDWPYDVPSLEHNLSDLTNDYKEFQNKETFRYSILDPNQERCIGCLYIRPSATKAYDCQIDLWFIQEYQHLEKQFIEDTDQWLRSTWKFSKIAYPGREISWEEYYSS